VKSLGVTAAESVTICGERSRIAGEITVGVAVASVTSVTSVTTVIATTIVIADDASIVSSTVVSATCWYTTSDVTGARTPSN